MPNLEDLAAKLYAMGSTEASTIGEGLESCWWDETDDEKAKALAIEFCRNIQGWAKKAEEVLTGVREQL